MDKHRARSVTAAVTSIAAAVLLTCVNAFAQNAAQPQRGPELDKIAYFVGDWKTDGEMSVGVFDRAPGSAFTSTDHMEWMPGGFFVTGRAESITPNGRQFQLSILGYNAKEKVYTFNSFNSAGVRTSATGTVNGDTWTWTSADDVGGGHTLGVRHTIRVLSPSAFTFRFEISSDGQAWSTFSEGKTTKID